MRFNRRLQPFSVISLDLDDTLYTNGNIIVDADNAQQQFLLSQVEQASQFNHDFWNKIRRQVFAADPSLQHNVSRWRHTVIKAALLEVGVSEPRAQSIATQAFEIFITIRQQVTVDSKMVDVVKQLSQKVPVVAISNGNASVAKLAAAPYISMALRADDTYRCKPYPDMFDAVAAEYKVSTGEILHVGDDTKTDIQGGNDAGCQTVWTNQFTQEKQYPGRILANVEISDLASLLQLL